MSPNFPDNWQAWELHGVTFLRGYPTNLEDMMRVDFANIGKSILVNLKIINARKSENDLELCSLILSTYTVRFLYVLYSCILVYPNFDV